MLTREQLPPERKRERERERERVSLRSPHCLARERIRGNGLDERIRVSRRDGETSTGELAPPEPECVRACDDECGCA